MAQFAAQGRLRLLFTAEGVSFGVEAKDPCHGKLKNGGLLKFPDGHASVPFPKPRLLLKRFTRFSCAEVRLSVGEDAVFDEYDGTEFETDELSCFRGLVLDISYRPVNVVCWKRAICLEFMDKADVLEYYDQTINSPSGSFNIPAVLRVPHLLQVVKRRRIKNTLSRKNIFYRDSFMCQYCSSKQNMTVDHVFPVARGGKWSWENLVAACAKCNSRKGHKTLEEANMKLIKMPKIPKDFDILAIPLTNTAIKMLQIRKGTPQEWRQYL